MKRKEKEKRIYQRLSALTEEEQAFAEKHHDEIERYLRRHRLDISEYYDVAVFGYLKAVKNWFARQELHQYSFSTIAKTSIRSYVGNCWRANDRRIKTICLNVPFGENENFTLMDFITYDNLDYSPLPITGDQY